MTPLGWRVAGARISVPTRCPPAGGRSGSPCLSWALRTVIPSRAFWGAPLRLWVPPSPTHDAWVKVKVMVSLARIPHPRCALRSTPLSPSPSPSAFSAFASGLPILGCPRGVAQRLRPSLGTAPGVGRCDLTGSAAVPTPPRHQHRSAAAPSPGCRPPGAEAAACAQG